MLLSLAIRRRLAGLAARLGMGLALLVPAVASAAEVSVFAAASLKTAMDEITAGFAAETGDRATVTYAGSSVLARQIGQGAPADVFISANAAWMDLLEAADAIDPGSRFDLVTNRIVLIAHGTQAQQIEVGPGLDLPKMLGEGRLAMALVEAVPAGIYGKAALQSLGLWADVAPLVAQTDNARAALALVALGAAPLGIVYATDAAADPRVTAVGTFPADSHPHIIYPAAAVAGRETPAAARFLAYLRGPKARTALERQGFAMAGE